MFHRVGRTIAALGLGQIIHLLTQVTLPPVFIAGYGVEGYALWLLLTAAASHLTTLDFGLQTYVVNRLIILHQQGNLPAFHQTQSVACRIALGMMAGGLLVAGAVFVFPIASWLGAPNSTATQWTLFLIGAQILSGVVFGQLNGLHRVMGEAARGVAWHNAQKTVLYAGVLGLALARAPFWFFAAFQALTVLLSMVALAISLRRKVPDLFPRWNYWHGPLAWGIVRESAFFGLFTLNQALVFQMPVLLLNRFCDATAVVAFSTGRTLFSLSRQGVNVLLASVAPELTRLVGRQDRTNLARVYRFTETAVFSASIIGCVGLFLAAPWLMRHWLSHQDLFDAQTFVLLMGATLALLVKDTKLNFQYSANEHIPAALMTSASYVLMLGFSWMLVREWGASAFLMIWIATELAQTAFIHRANARLLEGQPLSAWPLARFVGLGLLLGAGLWFGEPWLRSGTGWVQILKLILVEVAVVALCAWLFDLAGVMREAARQVRRWRPNRGNTPPLQAT